MLNTPSNEENDILERLRHPERESQRHKMSRGLFVRNILNSVFIILAVIAMTGIIATGKDGNIMTWYALGLFAVVVKMVEVVLRMPGMKKH